MSHDPNPTHKKNTKGKTRDNEDDMAIHVVNESEFAKEGLDHIDIKRLEEKLNLLKKRVGINAEENNLDSTLVDRSHPSCTNTGSVHNRTSIDNSFCPMASPYTHHAINNGKQYYAASTTHQQASLAAGHKTTYNRDPRTVKPNADPNIMMQAAGDNGLVQDPYWNPLHYNEVYEPHVPLASYPQTQHDRQEGHSPAALLGHPYAMQERLTNAPQVSHTIQEGHPYAPHVGHAYAPQMRQTYMPRVQQHYPPQLRPTYAPRLRPPYTPPVRHPYASHGHHTYTPQAGHPYGPQFRHRYSSQANHPYTTQTSAYRAYEDNSMFADYWPQHESNYGPVRTHGTNLVDISPATSGGHPSTGLLLATHPYPVDSSGEFEVPPRSIFNHATRQVRLNGGTQAGCSVPAKIKAKIWLDKYVDFFDILYPDRDSYTLALQDYASGHALNLVNKKKEISL